jgi:hypothetical protein
MDSDSVPRQPLLPLVNLHNQFPRTPDFTNPATSTVCVVCREPGADWTCERCKLPMHGACQWGPRGIASERERRAYDVLATEDEYELVIFLCQGCRS